MADGSIHAWSKMAEQLVARMVLPSTSTSLRINIDATKKGNISRFMNHSCDGGNLLLVLVSCKGELLPRVALFAARDIALGEELTFSYGQPNSQAVAGEGPTPLSSAGQTRGASRSQRRCFCGTAACSGFMPTDDV